MDKTKENSEIAKIISKLNNIETSWNTQFEHSPHAAICFSASHDGTLYLNDISLGVQVSEIDVESIFVDVEFFGFQTVRDETYEIQIHWPYQGKPYFGMVSHTFPLMAAN